MIIITTFCFICLRNFKKTCTAEWWSWLPGHPLKEYGCQQYYQALYLQSLRWREEVVAASCSKENSTPAEKIASIFRCRYNVKKSGVFRAHSTGKNTHQNNNISISKYDERTDEQYWTTRDSVTLATGEKYESYRRLNRSSPWTRSSGAEQVRATKMVLNEEEDSSPVAVLAASHSVRYRRHYYHDRSACSLACRWPHWLRATGLRFYALIIISWH